MENKHLILLILIIIFALVSASVGLILASNHSNNPSLINASSTNDSDENLTAPVISTSSDYSNLSDSDSDNDTYEDEYNYSYDDSYTDYDYDYDYEDYIDDDYNYYEEDY